MITQPVIETITPEIASDYLRRNTSNRRVKRKDVESYARQLRTGTFQTTHQGIAFDEDGTLVDGQHRLLAIVAAGVPATMVVTRNVPKSAMNVIDRGSSRTLQDVMCISYPGDDEGAAIMRSTLALSAIRQLVVYGYKELKLSADEVINVYKEFEKQFKFLYHAAISKDIGSKRSQIISAAAAAMACGVSEDAITKFLRVFRKADIVDCADYNVRAALNWRRQIDEARFRGTSLSNKTIFLGTQNAIWNFVHETDVSRIAIPKTPRFDVSARIASALDAE